VIHVVTPYGRAAPSSRVRVFEWLDRITEPHVLSSYLSHRNSSPSFISRHPFATLRAERRLRNMSSERPHRLLLHREASPLSRGHLEERLLESAEFGVYDFDDALQWDRGEGGLLRRVAPKAGKAFVATQCADRVIAGNPILAEWASEHNEDVVVIPSCVAPDAYKMKPDYELRDPPRLGWIGSVDNEVYLRPLARVLREVHRQTGARLTMISSLRPTLGDLEEMIDRVVWSEATQYTTLADFDIGLAPLPDRPYERGKCGYKLLQYAAAGTPVIGSPVGINEQILAQFGMPAPSNDAEWLDAILTLLGRSSSTRAAIGAGARVVTQQHYSYDAWLTKWKQAVGLESGPAEPPR
jgi:glycosyltransferase involved in cell wall biosynthesis